MSRTAAAVLSEDADRAVFVVEDGVARRRTVDLGYTSADRVEVVDGLAPEDAVIVVGQSAVKDGTPVTADRDGNRI